MGVTLRSGREEDIDRVLALWADAGAEPTHTDDAAGLAALVARDPGALIVAVDDASDAMVGSVIAGWDGWRGSIYRMVVAPTWRGQGLGTRLVAFARQRLEGQGAVRLQAIVVENDGRALGFWAASGWERRSHRVRFVLG